MCWMESFHNIKKYATISITPIDGDAFISAKHQMKPFDVIQMFDAQVRSP